MKKIFLLIYIILLPVLCFAEEHIYLSIGESHFLQVNTYSNIRVQKKGILGIKDLGSKLQIVGKKLGQTHIYNAKNKYTFTVVNKVSYETWKKLSHWVHKRRGLYIELNERGVFIKGRFLIISDYLDLREFLDETSQYQIQALITPSLKNEITDFIKNLLEENNLPQGQLSFEPQLSIRLYQDSSTLISQYKKLLNPYGIEIIKDQQNYSQKPTVKIQLHIAHVKKSFLRIWGVGWPQQATASLIDAKKLVLNPLEISLNSLESNGWGKVLASPIILAESGQPAQFHSGGEFPVRTTTQFSNNVHWKPYGLFLKTKSQASANGQLKIQISAELSAIDKSLSADGVPGMIRNKIETTLNMEKPQPILLSGLLKKDSSQNRQGLAWLSQIPLLQPLFSTGEILDNEHDLIFLLIPSIL